MTIVYGSTARRRPGRDGGHDRRGERLPGAAALDGRRRAREPRGVAVGERLRGGRLRDADHTDGERRQRIVEHDRLHVQGGRGRRHLERRGHGHRAGRLARADRREHDVVARRAQLRRADRHRLGRDARRERAPSRSPTGRRRRRRRVARRPGRRRNARRPAARSRRSPRRRRSTSTHATAPARSPVAPSTVGLRLRRQHGDVHVHGGRGRDERRRRDGRRAGRLERAEHHVGQRRLHGRAAPAPSPSPRRRSPSRP